jgi:hypothetical protein
MIGLVSASSIKDSLQFFETDYLIAAYEQDIYINNTYFIMPNIPLYNSSDNLMVTVGSSNCTTNDDDFICNAWTPGQQLFPHDLGHISLDLSYKNPNYSIPDKPIEITINTEYSISGVVFNKSMTYEVDFYPLFQGQGGDVSTPTLASPIMFQTSPLNVQSSYNNEPQYFMKCFGEQSLESSPYLQLNTGTSKIQLLNFIDSSSSSITCFPMIAIVNSDTHYTLSVNFTYNEYMPNNNPVAVSQESSTEIHLIY